jgi:hypothetical protein
MIKEIIPFYLDELTRKLYQHDMSSQILFRGVFIANPNNDSFFYVEVRCANVLDIVGTSDNPLQEGKDCILSIYEVIQTKDTIVDNTSPFRIKRHLKWDRIRFYNGASKYYASVSTLQYDAEKKAWYYKYTDVNRFINLLNTTPLHVKVESYMEKKKKILYG